MARFDPTTQQVLHLASPYAKAEYVQSFAQTTLEPFAIDSPLRIAHFMAQILHESGGFTILRESLHYTTAGRLMAVWPSRFPNEKAAVPFLKNPPALAEKVYAGRMGNVPGSGDAYRFVGRGFLQITGRESYERIGKLLGIPLADQPDLAIASSQALRVAAAEWQTSRCNEAADADDLRLVTRRVNGGLIGLEQRAAWLVRTKAIWS